MAGSAQTPRGHARHTIDCDLLPDFTCAYLRMAGDECAFIETNTAHAVPKLLQTLSQQGRRPEDVRWIVVTHAHLDHAAGAGVLLNLCPNATLLAHPLAATHLIEPAKLIASAKRVYGEAQFATMYGEILPVPAERVRTLADRETFELGDATFQVFHTAGHAKHHFVIHDPWLESVYTGDAFGLVYPTLQHSGRVAIASTSPIDFDAAEARKSVDLIVGLGARYACLTHFDAIEDLTEVASQVKMWIDRSEDWLQQCLESDEDVDTKANRIATQYWAALSHYALSEKDLSYLSLDVELNTRGIAIAAARMRRY